MSAFLSASRTVQTFRTAAYVFGPSPLDRALFAYRESCDRAAGYLPMLDAARAKLGLANATRRENRRVAQGIALRELNTLRAAMHRAVDARDAAEVVLLALGGTVEPVRAAQVDVLPVGCIAVDDDPDMAAFRAPMLRHQGGRA